MYTPKRFQLHELLPEDFYKKNKVYGHTLWYLFDDRLLRTADRLSIIYGGMTANTWFTGGIHQYRVWRPFDCKVGADLSQHKWGRALDLIPINSTAEIIRQDILANPMSNEFRYITCIEKDISWLHIDVRNWDKINEGILIIGG